MKIGLLTLHRPCNFGANLQAYASCCHLISLGHKVKVIDFVRPMDSRYLDRVSRGQADAHRLFVESRLPLTRLAVDSGTLCDIVAEERFDCVLIGSDAVWRAPEDDCIFFAKWLFEDKRTKNIPVCSLSAAYMGDGFEELSQRKRNDIKKCLDKFRFITVRDKWTRLVISRDIYGGEDRAMAINPDPVFLLPQFVENEVWESRGLEDGKYILMTLSKDWLKNRKKCIIRWFWFIRFKHLAHRKGLQLVELPLPEGKSGMHFDFCIDCPIDPMQWFLFLKHARAFIGLRFHSVVSCISLGTPFFSIDSYGDKSDHRRWLDRLGLHEKARALDYKSKIRNLLVDSPLESYRTGNIEWESPKDVFCKIMCVPPGVIEEFRKEKQEQFCFNLANILNSVNRMPRAILSLTESCTGCFACANACPQNAITMPENHEGFYFPVIDSSKCIDCGICDNVCPEITDKPFVSMRRAYYGWSKDDGIRKSSSSGGIFAMLSRIILDKGGVVYGAAWNVEDGICLETTSSDEVPMLKLQKSKYTQSYVGDAFRRIRDNLISGRQVLFCGAPCQTAGLRSYLQKEYNNLLCIDFICHGVPSMSILRKDLAYHGLSNVEDIIFRPKNQSWLDDLRIIDSYGMIKDFKIKSYEYFKLFLKRINLRRSCFSCKYFKGKRCADMSIADFWAVKEYKPELWDKRGISLILVNTSKGEMFWNSLIDSGNAQIFDLPMQYAEYVYCWDKRNPLSKYDKDKRNTFIGNVSVMGYKDALVKYGLIVSRRNRFKHKMIVFINSVKSSLKLKTGKSI